LRVAVVRSRAPLTGQVRQHEDRRARIDARRAGSDAKRSISFPRTSSPPYSFEPHKLTSEQIEAKSKDLDGFWDEVSALDASR